MKNILNKLVVLLLAGFALAACTEHTEYDDTGFSAVEKLLYPSDGYALDLIEQADANLYFEWEVSKVGTPVYTVVFLDAAKKEIGRYLADNNGQKSSLKMLHSQLNAIAGDAGIEPDAAGDLYWTVSAGLGGAEQLSPAEPHKLTVKRYASIDAPYHLYVTGEGSEFGTEPAAAKQMRDPPRLNRCASWATASSRFTPDSPARSASSTAMRRAASVRSVSPKAA